MLTVISSSALYCQLNSCLRELLTITEGDCMLVHRLEPEDKEKTSIQRYGTTIEKGQQKTFDHPSQLERQR